MQEDKYREQRQAVIDLFRMYDKSRKKFLQSLNLSIDALDDDDVEGVQKEVDKLKANEYFLAVVGESKSGKSAFINALLGKPILPTGVLQCTSGIIEIVDTDNDQHKKKVYLKVKYAVQPETEKVEYEASLDSDTTPLQTRLKEIAAIKEEYRSLPTFQINQYLIDEKQIDDSLVQKICKELLPKDKKELDKEGNNPYKLSNEKFAQRVAKYLDEYKDLTKIPVGIYVGYPVGLKFANIRIVDTPGVNARGGLKDATIEHIIKANAVIFIHLLKNIASESLQDFFKKSVPKQAYENTFLFLTHKAHATKEAVEKTLAEAKQLFPDIQDGRIVAVDSMLKLISDELAAVQSLDVLMEDEEKRKLLADYAWRLKGDVSEIQPAVFKESNFEEVQNLLNQFSGQALRKQLEWVVKQVANGYKQQQEDYARHIKLQQQKTELSKAPEQFDHEIDRLKKLLEDYNQRLITFSKNKRAEYLGKGNKVVEEKFSRMAEKYEKLLDDACNEDEVRKHVMDYCTDCEKEATDCTTKLNWEYQAEMKKVGTEFETIHFISPHQISPPQISLVSISKKAEEQAYAGTDSWGEIVKIMHSKFLYAKDYYFKDREKFINALIGEAKSSVTESAGKMPGKIGEIFGSYDKEFNEKLKRIIKERQAAYEQLKQDKDDAEKLRQLEHNRETVVEQLKKIEYMNGQLSQA